MDRREWLTSNDPEEMLKAVLEAKKCRSSDAPFWSDRRLRLFWIAYCREMAKGNKYFKESNAGRSMTLLESCDIAEEIADGVKKPAKNMYEFGGWGTCEGDIRSHIEYVTNGNLNFSDGLEKQALVILRDVFGFRKTTWQVEDENWVYAIHEGLNPLWLTPDVVSLAQAAYEFRTPEKLLDPTRLLVLADALEEAGCNDIYVLNHLRGLEPCGWCLQGSHGNEQACGGRGYGKYPMGWHGWLTNDYHCKGCWIIQLLLQKD